MTSRLWLTLVFSMLAAVTLARYLWPAAGLVQLVAGLTSAVVIVGGLIRRARRSA
jgi:hypothetical protein